MTIKHDRLLPELLAPGGDLLSVRAALDAGADAVYLGLSRFNARRKAANITDRDLPGLVLLAHERGARIFVTANILLTEEEIPDYIRFISFCLGAGVDGLIIADLGILTLVPALFPGAELHASTQMTTHNSAQISFLRSFGVGRVNLARELSVPDIAGLTAHAHGTGMETEVFIHGAYCISFSGQCLMSSFIGGESGNRGICFQPCRRRYAPVMSPPAHGSAGTGGQPANLLSLRDNNAIPIADDLVSVGVDSLKIEGRMKNFRYVHTVVAAWRRRLDRIARGERDEDSYDELSGVFNRDFSIGYALDRVGPGMFVDTPYDRSYREVGTVVSYRADTGTVTVTGEPVEPGTKIVICTEENQLVCGGQVEEVLPGGRGSSSMRIRIESELRQKILPGQTLLSAENRAETQGLEERLAGMKPRKIRLRARLSGKEGQPLILELAAERSLGPPERGVQGATTAAAGRGGGGINGSNGAGKDGEPVGGFPGGHGGHGGNGGNGGYPVRVTVPSGIPLSKAVRNPLTPETAAAQIGRLGDTPFELESCEFIDMGEDLFLPVSELNSMRRKGVVMLGYDPDRYRADVVPAPFPDTPLHGMEIAGKTVDAAAGRNVRSRLALLFSDPAEAAQFMDLNADTLPDADILLEAGDPGRFPSGTGMIPWLPTITREEDLPSWRQLVEREGPPCVAGNTGLGFIAGNAGIPWIAGPGFNCANSWAFRTVRERGAAGAFLSAELSRDQAAAISAPDNFSLWMPVMGPVLLMTTRQCLINGREGPTEPRWPGSAGEARSAIEASAAPGTPCRKVYTDRACHTSCSRHLDFEGQGERIFHVVKSPWQETRIFNDPILWIPEAVTRFRGKIDRFMLDFRNFPFYSLSMETRREIARHFSSVLGGPGTGPPPRPEYRPPFQITSGLYRRGLS